MRPGKVAQTGLDAARPLLESISDLMGWIAFFENFIQIACLLFAWALVLLAFFILAIQLFVTLIEFKLTTLAGFVLIPFGLFGKTAFMAERVLGNVVSSGIKVLVLAVIIGIGSTLFSQFTAGFGGATPTIDDAMAIVLAALSLLGLGIFGPGIANGLVSGGPQLGAGRGGRHRPCRRRRGARRRWRGGPCHEGRSGGDVRRCCRRAGRRGRGRRSRRRLQRRLARPVRRSRRRLRHRRRRPRRRLSRRLAAETRDGARRRKRQVQLLRRREGRLRRDRRLLDHGHDPGSGSQSAAAPQRPATARPTGPSA
jgi:hypothetical protein